MPPVAAAQSPDVAVVGGGPIGLACAWRAARRGLSRRRARRAASPAPGTSPPACSRRSPRPSSASARCSSWGCAAPAMFEAFCAELAEATGHDVGLRRSGTLVVARDADEAAALERLIAFRELARPGASTRLRPSQARRLEPALAPTVRLALDVAGDHSIDPRRLVARAAARPSRCAAAAWRASLRRGRPRDGRRARGRLGARGGRGRARRRRARRRARAARGRGARARAPGQGPGAAAARPARPRPRRRARSAASRPTSSRAATAATCSARRWRSAAGTRRPRPAASTS